MAEEIEKRFNMKQKAFTEEISWNNKTKKYYIKRTFPKSSEVEEHELSEWGFVRKVETFLLIARQIESVDLEEPTKMIFYRLNFTYEIRSGEEFEDWFLVPSVRSDPDDRHNKKFLQINMKNANTGECLPIPIANALYKGEYEFLKITKGKSIKISKSELEDAVTSGECLGIFDMQMKNRMVS